MTHPEFEDGSCFLIGGKDYLQIRRFTQLGRFLASIVDKIARGGVDEQPRVMMSRIVNSLESCRINR